MMALLMTFAFGLAACGTPAEEAGDGGQNPVMNFIGEYQSDRAHALVECSGTEDALITIEWGGSAAELARWDIFGRLNTETLTINYSGVTKSIVTYDDSGEIVSQEPEYEDGTGTITFNDDGTFTWHEDQSEYGVDMVLSGSRFKETEIVLCSLVMPKQEVITC